MTDHRLHSLACNWPQGQPCLEFSTDGSEAGALIAHAFGTQELDAIPKDSLIKIDGVWHLNTGTRNPDNPKNLPWSKPTGNRNPAGLVPAMAAPNVRNRCDRAG